MSPAPITAEPAADCTALLQDELTGFIDFGKRLVRLSVEEAEAGTLPVEKAAKIYDWVTCSVRRSVLLIRRLAEPVKTVDRVAARKRLIRVVEDNIHRHADDPEHAETLHEELLERLDTPDLEDEIRTRPIEEVIADIVRDLGLAAALGNQTWKCRSPADIALLCARAKQIPTDTTTAAARSGDCDRPSRGYAHQSVATVMPTPLANGGAAPRPSG